MIRALLSVAALAALTSPLPADAQQIRSGAAFLDAVRNRDGVAVASAINDPGFLFLNSRDRDSGDGALHIIVRARDLTWLTLMANKARPDLQNNRGETALFLASMIGWKEGAELLLKRQATVDLGNSQRETPLIIATKRGNLEMVKLLASKNADPTRTDASGMSALDHARRLRLTAITTILEASTGRNSTVGSGRAQPQDRQSARPDLVLKGLGITLKALTPEIVQQLKLRNPNPNGIVIAQVDPNSIAEGKGLRAGDVVLSISRVPTRSFGELTGAIETARRSGRSTLMLEVRRVSLPVYLDLPMVP